MRIVVISGGFDPIHTGHIDYFYAARKLGDQLIVGVNSDAWLQRKKGRAFMPMTERFSIVSSMKPVDHTVEFNDDDGSACALLEHIKRVHPDDEIIFANGGDRRADNIPEMSVTGVTFAFGVGGEHKRNSSSWILEEWKAPRTERAWGYYRVLHEHNGIKVKELTVEPGQSLSMQRHQHRAEYWMVSEGECIVNTQMPSGYRMSPVRLSKFQEFRIPVSEWHQLTNPFNKPCKIVEIQYGDQCVEEDIERQQ
jgi:cytidyltransferase-like protein